MRNSYSQWDALYIGNWYCGSIVVHVILNTGYFNQIQVDRRYYWRESRQKVFSDYYRQLEHNFYLVGVNETSVFVDVSNCNLSQLEIKNDIIRITLQRSVIWLHSIHQFSRILFQNFYFKATPQCVLLLQLPIWHVLLPSRQWKRRNNVWNLFKSDNEGVFILSLNRFHSLFYYYYCWL